MTIESRVAALEAIRDEQRSRIDLFYNKDWARLTEELHQIQTQLRDMQTSIAALSGSVKITLQQHAKDLQQVEQVVEALPARALTAGGIFIAILVGIAQLSGRLKI